MQQAIRTLANPVRTKVMIPGSKSITNRALLLAALAEGVSKLNNIQISDDTVALIQALRELGITIQLHDNLHICTVIGTQGIFPNTQATLWCAEAGTVARFLLAACAANPGVYHFSGAANLNQRPLEQLLTVLQQQGAQISPDNAQHLPLTITGTDMLAGGEVVLDSAETSQFLSALLMVAPYARTPLTINANNLVSKPYVNLTCVMMAEFGVQVHRIHQGRFMVPIPQRYQAQEYFVEPDLSTASYFFAAAAVTGGTITMQPLVRSQTKQADVNFLSVLEKMGCQVMETLTELTLIGPDQLTGIEVDMSDYSDTFPTLAAIAPFASSPVTISNIGHTCHKESNRIQAMKAELEKMGITVECGKDWIKIFPGSPQGCMVHSHHDHRIAMALSIIGLRVPGVIIDHAECVTKTCPDFFTQWHYLTEARQEVGVV